MQLDPGLGSTGQSAGDRLEDHPPCTKQGHLVYPIERSIHHACKIAFNHELLSRQKTHKVTDGAVFAQRDQGSEVAVVKPLQRLAVQTTSHLFCEMGGLLAGGLGPRRDGPCLSRIGETGAVADSKHISIACRLEGLRHDELIAPVRLEAIEILQKIRRFDPGRPDHQLRRNEVAVSKTDPVPAASWGRKIRDPEW